MLPTRWCGVCGVRRLDLAVRHRPGDRLSAGEDGRPRGCRLPRPDPLLRLDGGLQLRAGGRVHAGEDGRPAHRGRCLPRPHRPHW